MDDGPIDAEPPEPPAHRLAATVIVAIAVAALLGLIVWSFVASDPPSSSPTPTDRSDPSALTAPTAPRVSSTAPVTTPGPSTTIADTTTTVIPTTAPTATVELTRPIIGLDGCRTVSAGQRPLTIEGAYVWAKQEGLALQVYVPTGGAIDTSFAVAVRSFATPRFDPATANGDVGGLPARITFPTATRGEILWRLPDGSEAYLRTSSMTDDELLELADALVARDTADPTPAFDLNGDEYELIDEGVSPFDAVEMLDSNCELDDGAWLRVTLLDARPLVQALFLTDRPDVPTVSRLLPNGRLLTVSAGADVPIGIVDAALDSVRDATDDEWSSLPPD